MVELLILLWQSVPEEQSEGGGGGGGGAVAGAAGGGGLLAQAARVGLDEAKAALVAWQVHNLMRVVMCIALLVAIVLMLTRPRQRTEFADLMVWMRGERWERSELGAAGAHVDRWPLAQRRGEERERWRRLRPAPRRVRSEGALCDADLWARRSRPSRLRACRTV